MRTWIKAPSPRFMSRLGMLNGCQWNPQLDRCWTDDKREYDVCSRLIKTEWGTVEHVTIQRIHSDDEVARTDGERDIPWAEKQAIKDEIFGKNRVAIEVFPSADRMVDLADVYHLWVFEEGFRLPFGIHPLEYDPEQYVERSDDLTDADVVEFGKITGTKIPAGAFDVFKTTKMGANRAERRAAKKGLPKSCVRTGIDLCGQCNCMVNVFMDSDGQRWCGKGKHKFVKKAPY